jgi:hypothetical protein
MVNSRDRMLDLRYWIFYSSNSLPDRGGRNGEIILFSEPGGA